MEAVQKVSLAGFEPQDRARVVAIASQLVEGMVVNGEIACTDEAIRGAMPQALRDAKAAVAAANEFVCG